MSKKPQNAVKTQQIITAIFIKESDNGTGKQKKALTLDERRAAAIALRKPREWEKP